MTVLPLDNVKGIILNNHQMLSLINSPECRGAATVNGGIFEPIFGPKILIYLKKDI